MVRSINSQVGVDVVAAVLQRSYGTSRGALCVSHCSWSSPAQLRQNRLEVKLYHGDILEAPPQELVDRFHCGALILQEVWVWGGWRNRIEHLKPTSLSRLAKQITTLGPTHLYVSTPHVMFNPIFQLGGEFRAKDHEFEWTETEFSQWLASNLPEYEGVVVGIGFHRWSRCALDTLDASPCDPVHSITFLYDSITNPGRLFQVRSDACEVWDPVVDTRRRWLTSIGFRLEELILGPREFNLWCRYGPATQSALLKRQTGAVRQMSCERSLWSLVKSIAVPSVKDIDRESELLRRIRRVATILSPRIEDIWDDAAVRNLAKDFEEVRSLVKLL